MPDAKETKPRGIVGWIGHVVTGFLGAFAAVIGVKSLDDLASKVGTAAKRQFENLKGDKGDRELYTRTIARMAARGNPWAAYASVLERRRRAAEKHPFAENRQVALVSQLLKACQGDNAEAERLRLMRWLALKGDLDFAATLRGVEDSSADEVIRAAKHVARDLRPAIQELNRELEQRVAAKLQAQAQNPLPRTAAERRRYIIRREGFFRWMIGG